MFVCRFLCPPPSALLAGPHWFSPLIAAGSTASSASTSTSSSSSPFALPPSPAQSTASAARAGPAVELTITHEAPPKQPSGPVWISPLGSEVSTADPDQVPIYGTVLGKQLIVSEGENVPTGAQAGKRQVRARARITAPAAGSADGVEIGTFDSKEIKVISKPQRKKAQGTSGAGAQAKGTDLLIYHGTLVSAFHRAKSQTHSTRYLLVSDSASHVKDSSGTGLVSAELWAQRKAASRRPAMFQAKVDAWDAFIIWQVDCRASPSSTSAPKTAPSSATVDPDWPQPPINALSYDVAQATPICFNQTVVLQCPRSGVISPVLVLRRMDQTTTALGGDPAQHADPQTSADACVPPGERAGDAIGQLSKVAFEIYSPTLIPYDATKAGLSGAFLGVVGDCVQTLCPTTARTLFPAGLDIPMAEPIPAESPAPPRPASASNGHVVHPAPIRPSASRRHSASTVASDDEQTNHGGKVVRRRTSASSLSNPTAGSNGKGKKRTNSTDGTSARPALSKPVKAASAGQSSARWSIEIPENAVWTMVGVESVRHTFFIPGGERDGEPGVLAGPVTPLVAVSRYLPPGTKVVNDPHARGYEATFVNGTQEQMITV